MRHGFSLIEAMIVVALLAVLASLGVPSLLPEVKKAQLDGSAEAVIGFVHAARADAINHRRCVRVIIRRAQPPQLTEQMLNTFDCDGSTGFGGGPGPETAPRLETVGITQPLWIDQRNLDLNGPLLRIGWDPAPSDSDAVGAPAAGNDNIAEELRFRPTGRIWSRDLFIDNDDAVLRLSHDLLPPGQDFKQIVIEAHGMMCTLPRGVSLSPNSSDPNDLECPP